MGEKCHHRSYEWPELVSLATGLTSLALTVIHFVLVVVIRARRRSRWTWYENNTGLLEEQPRPIIEEPASATPVISHTQPKTRDLFNIQNIFVKPGLKNKNGPPNYWLHFLIGLSCRFLDFESNCRLAMDRNIVRVVLRSVLQELLHVKVILAVDVAMRFNLLVVLLKKPLTAPDHLVMKEHVRGERFNE